MRRVRPFLAVIVTLVASVFVAICVASSAQAGPYQYTIRVFPGNRGTLSNDPVVLTFDKGEPSKDKEFSLYSVATATISDQKYIQIGFRVSGTDTLIGGNALLSNVTEDTDYVVAYGVAANAVPYTLRYVEYETGKELAPSETFYGREGDKPVAAYKHIEGYRPLYLSLTGTLHADEENVWTFEYVALAEGEVFDESTMSTTQTVEVPGNTTTNTTTNEVPGNTTVNTTDVPGTTTTRTGEGGGGGGETVTVVPGTTTTNRTEVPGTTTTTVNTEVGPITDGGTTAAPATPTAPAAEAGTTTPVTETGGETGGAAATAPPATQEILDLDTPLAGPSSNRTTSGPEGAVRVNPTPMIGLAIVLTLAIVFLLFYLFKRKKDEEDEEAKEE